MEAKFSRKAVAIFITSVTALFAGFVVWFYSQYLLISYKPYKILCSTSVAGLYEGSFITYHGVRVGKVDRLNISPEHNNNVLVSALIDTNVIIKEDTYASLSMKGLTGYMTIELSGGSTESPVSKSDFIPYQLSMFDKIMGKTPDSVAKLDKAVDQITETLEQFVKILPAVQNTIEMQVQPLLKNSVGLINSVQQNLIGGMKEFIDRLNSEGLLQVLGSSKSL